MYKDGLGLMIIGSFQDHDGFDGVMLGHPKSPYHLEFTNRAGHRAGRAPTEDNLLVFYIPDEDEWHQICENMEIAGFIPVSSFNPYWELNGRTFEDIDGYRIVLQNGTWDR